jgi:hypothetical protein
MTSINSLPLELLIESFAFCAATDALAPLTLAQVCVDWNVLIHSSPAIWQVICLDDRRPMQSAHAQARLWIQSSVPLPFHVVVNLESTDPILSLLSPFLSTKTRWSSLTLTGARALSIDFSDSTVLSSLNDLSLSILPKQDISDDATVQQSIIAPYSPLWQDRFLMSLELTVLPSKLAPLTFTTISLIEESFTVRLNPSDILRFLSACPFVETLSFVGWIRTTDAHASLSGLRVADLPNLKSLSIQRTSFARALLSFIDCPQLAHLYLGHLNSDMISPSSYMEDGDSDDEANDFSRSPSTDRATGVGLRNLMKRCNPPLRTLEMDYSDMRTKDFIFIFDRLPRLESLLIVASDMSNKVIKLLKPTHAENSIACDPIGPTLPTGAASQKVECSALPPSPNDPSRRSPCLVRLPKLRILELYQCNEVSGDVLVDVLSSRMRFTDTVSPEDTLQEVAIGGLDSFTGQHFSCLKMKFGQRVTMGEY